MFTFTILDSDNTKIGNIHLLNLSPHNIVEALSAVYDFEYDDSVSFTEENDAIDGLAINVWVNSSLAMTLVHK